MDHRERKRLEHEIDRGVPNVGIRKVDGDALEKENRALARSPLVKGAGVGLSISGPAGLVYLHNHGIYDRSPLGLFREDYVLVGLLLIALGPLLGAGLAWMVKEGSFGKPPKDAP